MIDPTKKKKVIGEFMLRKRLQSGLTMEAIKEKANMKFDQIKEIEKGSQAYTIDSLIKLCIVLEVDLFNLKL